MEDKKRKRQETADIERATPSVLQPVLDQLRAARYLLENTTQSKVGSEDYLLSQIRSELKTFERLASSFPSIKYEFCLSTLLQIDSGYWHDILAVHDVLSLVLCNKTVFNILSPVISARNKFSHTGSKFKFYKPVRLDVVRDQKNLPVSAKHLVFSKAFSKPVGHELPFSVASLRFEGSYGHVIIELPATITSLDFQYGLPKIKNYPAALTHLSFNWLNKGAFHSLPPSVTHLKIPYADTALPPHLHTLEMFNTSKHISNLPPSLQVLRLLGSTQDELPKPSFEIQLPASLTQVTFWHNYNQPLCKLPSTLTHLNLPGEFNQQIDSLPLALTHLAVGEKFNQSLDHLPASLTHLTVENEFNQSLDHLPASLTHLTVGEKFNQSMDHLPASLTHLTLGRNFNQSVDSLPPSLAYLGLGFLFNQRVDHLPARLRSLELNSKSFKKPLTNLPQLTRLSLRQEANHAPATDCLPTSITCLNIGSPPANQYITFPPSPCEYPRVPLPSSLQHLRLCVHESTEMRLSVPEATRTVIFEAYKDLYANSWVALVLVDFETRMIFFNYKK